MSRDISIVQSFTFVQISSFVRNHILSPLFEILFFHPDILGIQSHPLIKYSTEVRPDESISQVDLMPDDGNYNSDEEDVYGTSAPSAPISGIAASFSTTALHLRVTEETLEEARGFLIK